jgi:hypothetical protein
MRFLIVIILISLLGCGPSISTDNIKSISVITIDRDSHNVDSTEITKSEDLIQLLSKINTGTKELFLKFLPRHILFLNYADSVTKINISGDGNGMLIFNKGAYHLNNINELIESLKLHYRQYPKKGRLW